jgi:type II secretory pathway pseudopilin PulG
VNPIRRCRALNGFSLVELMLSLSLGLGISGVMLQGLMAEGQNGARFSQLLREQASQRRALELIKGDIRHATAVSANPDLEQHACSLSGRTPVLHMTTAYGPITYSVGHPPSAIWREQVLMRCGPAYGLDGAISGGSQPLNRVVIDGLAVQSRTWTGCEALLGLDQQQVVELPVNAGQGFVACLQATTGLLGLRLEQSFAKTAGEGNQHISQSVVVEAMPSDGLGVNSASYGHQP